MAKIDKSRYTKSQWKVIKEKRKLEKIASQERTSRPEISPTTDNIRTSFVLGNGTSRAPIAPEHLQQHGKIYGCNALYRTFEPDYLIAVDVKMILEIAKYGYQRTHEVWTNPNKAYHKIDNLNFFHPSKGWSSGPTALWLASQHHPERIFILGFDYKGLDDGARFNNMYADTINYKKSQDSATYYGNWLRQTKSVIAEHPNIRYYRVIQPDNYIPDELNNFNNLEHITVEDFQKMFNLS